jgi:hypothetical protein
MFSDEDEDFLESHNLMCVTKLSCKCRRKEKEKRNKIRQTIKVKRKIK